MLVASVAKPLKGHGTCVDWNWLGAVYGSPVCVFHSLLLPRLCANGCPWCHARRCEAFACPIFGVSHGSCCDALSCPCMPNMLCLQPPVPWTAFAGCGFLTSSVGRCHPYASRDHSTCAVLISCRAVFVERSRLRPLRFAGSISVTSESWSDHDRSRTLF